MKAFSEEWINAFAEKINSNKEFGTTSQEFEWSVILSVNTGENETNIFLDLKNGKCYSARIASAQDLEQVEFIISANTETWQKILTGALDPMMAVMTKKLELKKGNVSLLLQNVDSAKELLRSASQIPTEF